MGGMKASFKNSLKYGTNGTSIIFTLDANTKMSWDGVMNRIGDKNVQNAITRLEPNGHVEKSHKTFWNFFNHYLQQFAKTRGEDYPKKDV